MPKDSATRVSHRPDPLHKDLAAARRQPRLQRGLPQQFFDHILAKRQLGQPHHYTTKDISAIVRYLNEEPKVNSHYCRFPTQEEVNHHRSQARRLADRIRDERASKPLINRIEPLPLADRIAARSLTTPAVPLAEPKSVLINFKKITTEDLIGIFDPKLKAVSTRIAPVYELLGRSNIRDDLRACFEEFVFKFDGFTENFEARAPKVTKQQWQALNFGLREIGKVSFAGLRRNYEQIVTQLVYIYRDRYFDWIEDWEVD